MQVGANFHREKCNFLVWAPYKKKVSLLLNGEKCEMQNAEKGYFSLSVEGIKPNTEYKYLLNDQVSKPDPASHFQPNGVFGSSAVIDHGSFKWKDQNWRGLDLKKLIFYETHVGAFTPEGTFNAMLNRIEELADFGINALELMPVTQFSGKRNWGYDGVFPFAVQNTYGTPDELKKLVSQCHLNGVSVFIDFVYNHLGPEGNCLTDYGPYFSSTMTPWGPTFNFDGQWNEEVRKYFLENTIHWYRDYHIDGIRLDAVFAIHDSSPRHFLSELNDAVDNYSEETGKKLHLIAESGFNENKILTPTSQGGDGFDAQWLEDFEHALHVLLTGEKQGYYNGYGSVQDFADAITESYVYVGKENQRRRNPNESFRQIPTQKFVVFSQNHDQIGNRRLGERLTALSGFEAAKTATGIVLLSPYLPLLFMGEEYGETAPFLFFTDYQGKELANAAREGRKKEFASFKWKTEAPYPQSKETFEKSKLNWQLRYAGKNRKIAAYYQALIKLRSIPVFSPTSNRQIKAIPNEDKKLLFIQRNEADFTGCIIINFSKAPQKIDFPFKGEYEKILDSADAAWDGPGVSLLEKAAFGDKQVIQGYNMAVYFKRNLNGGENNG